MEVRKVKSRQRRLLMIWSLLEKQLEAAICHLKRLKECRFQSGEYSVKSGVRTGTTYALDEIERMN